MEQALMIAYVRDGFQSLAISPKTCNCENPSRTRTTYDLDMRDRGTNKDCQGLYLTTHQREFYGPTAGTPPPLIFFTRGITVERRIWLRQEEYK